MPNFPSFTPLKSLPMLRSEEQWSMLFDLLRGILGELHSLHHIFSTKKSLTDSPQEFVQVPFRGSEIYLLHKAFIDSGGSLNENYKTLLEKTVPLLANKTQKGFSAQSFCKYSDKVDPDAKETVKRFLLKMIRNIESYD